MPHRITRFNNIRDNSFWQGEDSSIAAGNTKLKATIKINMVVPQIIGSLSASRFSYTTVIVCM